MLKAIKENKEYTISQEQKNRYLFEGFDIIDESGKIIQYSPKKKIEYNKHVQILAEKDKEINDLKTALRNLEEEIAGLKASADDKKDGKKK